VRAKVGPASLVTAANVFAHIDGVHDVVEAILTMLDDRGVFVSESHYLMSFLDTVQYDTVYHEHLRHYSVASLKHLLEGHGLEILHARTIPTHGGSVRVYAAKAGAWPVQASVAEMLASEAARGTITEQLAEFRRKTVLSKLGLHAVLHKIKAEGGKIYGIGAPSRASTLVNYTGLDDNMLDCVLELPGSQKLGKYLPGTLIPVESEARLFDDPPDYALLLSWHIADELMPKLTEKGFKGGYIIPLPDARIVPGA
ncbi:MAG: methyltransferase, partial [Alphaproteobacteria bacterium]|nr:methyltransferase [Alphaproteobacteria bacterium]